MKLPKNLTIKMIMEAVEESMMDMSNPGFCLSCGNQQDGCEPDARNYECENCGKNQVYGAEELLIMFG